MQLSDYNFDLPDELIARYPLKERSDSRLLLLDSSAQAVADKQFRDLPDFLRPGDLLVLNDTRVIHARLAATKDTGAPTVLQVL